jgi:hypothetical protein
MITKLDGAAQPASEIQVIQIPGSISTSSLQLALQTMGAGPPDDLQTSKPNQRDLRNGNRNQPDRRRGDTFQQQRSGAN